MLSRVRKIIASFLGGRIAALMRKEFLQILRDRRLVISLVVAPTVQLIVLGSALNATVENLGLGVVDDSHTPQSRELVAALTESKSFRLAGYYDSVGAVGDAINRNAIDAGVVIPFDYARDLVQGRPVTVQFLLNATNVNTAQIAHGYADAVIRSYDTQLTLGGLHARFVRTAAPAVSRPGPVLLAPAFLYNPGLVSSWFIVTGVFGILLIMNGAIISSTVMLKERAVGTIEQLLMSPASASEIILAKIAPLFALLSAMALLALGLIRVVFQVPVHGSIVLVLSGAVLCLLSGIGIGTFIATVAKSAQQTLMAILFLQPPLASLSGALMPVEAMPAWLQPFTFVNPMFYFAVVTRGAMIKGSGLSVLWPSLFALFLFTAVLLALSMWRFRKQLG